jgi:hypothetical protein
MEFLCVSQQRELKNTIKLFGGSPCQKPLAEKIEIFSPCRFPIDFFYRVFGRFSA